MQTATKMIAVIDLIPLILFFLLKLIIIITKKNITIPIKNIIQNSNIEIGNKEEILPIIFSYKKPKFLVHHSANSTLLFKIDKQINKTINMRNRLDSNHIEYLQLLFLWRYFLRRL